MFCSKCGKQIMDNANVCPYCGCAQGNSTQVQYANNGYQNSYKAPVVEEDKVNVGLVILTIFVPLVGLILGIINLSKGLKKSGLTYLLVAIGVWVLAIIVTLVFWFIAMGIAVSSSGYYY